MPKPKKIMIIGCGGSGKSTLSKKLGKIWNLPVIHMDEKFWLPNWTMPDMADWMRLNKKLVAQEEWVLDGNYGSSMVMRMKAADLVIYLHMPTWLCVFRILKRTLFSWRRTRPAMAKGCKERFEWEFVQYVYRYNQDRHPGVMKRIDKYCSEKEVVILNSKKEVNHYLKSTISAPFS